MKNYKEFRNRIENAEQGEWFEMYIPDKRTGGYRKQKIYIPAKEEDE